MSKKLTDAEKIAAIIELLAANGMTIPDKLLAKPEKDGDA